MGDKAKYIENKEVTLFNDLNKAHKKLKEIANWYSLSNYTCDFTDRKNQMLYVQLVNNIYSELKALLINTKNVKLYKELEDIVTIYKLSDSAALEQLIIELQKEKEVFNKEYNLNFNQAIEACLNDNMFIVGEDFKKGCYIANKDGIAVLIEIPKNGFHESICNLPITDGVLKQQYKALAVVNKKTLGM